MSQIEGLSHYENVDILIWKNTELLIKIIYEQHVFMEKKKQKLK